jgi:SAM-dependent methyltransferase
MPGSPRNLFKRVKARLFPATSIWPPIDYELSDIKDQGLLQGQVLNAGCGWRDLSHLIEGELTNQDLTWPGDKRENVHIFSPLHQIPRPDNYFDAVLCIAVLEHVINPDAVMKELTRVLKPGGTLVASVPFLQPEHKVPTDFQRYTRDGLEVLFVNEGLKVIDIQPLFTVYHTIYWICEEWLQLKNNIKYRVAKSTILPAIAFLAKKSSTCSDKIASAFRVVATKPAS